MRSLNCNVNKKTNKKLDKSTVNVISSAILAVALIVITQSASIMN